MTSTMLPTTTTTTTKRLGRCYLLVFFVVVVVVPLSPAPPLLLILLLPIQPVTQQPLLMVELSIQISCCLIRTYRPTDFVLHYVNRVESIVYANGRANPGNPDTSARLRWSLRSDYSKIPQGTQRPQMESTGSPSNVHLIP
ncbi:hypothetical protein V1478_004621 [Vespula squamosa]|uniref:Uncharacterized protein n=1 Tax=Vespula squamosa TaxID=30214 RepID=A0ABD2BGQ1_VESSQ